MVSTTRYTVFRRSATGWQSFSTARKYIIERHLTVEEARRLCAQFNDHRTPAQERAGTKYEFTAEVQS